MPFIQAIIFCAFIFSGSIMAADAAKDPGSARVISTEGGADYSLYDKREKIVAGMKIPVNSVVRTDSGGEAAIEFFDGTLLEIGPDSEALLIDFADSPRDEAAIFTLNSGIVSVKAGDPALRAHLPLVAHTPQASVEVGDSAVVIQALGGKNHIFVDSADKGVVVRDKIHGEELKLFESDGVATIAPAGAGECSASSCMLKHPKYKKPRS